jgi:hypothetical protein
MSAIQDAAGDYVGSEVDFQRKLRTMQLWNYAIASGLPSIPADQKPPAPAANSAPVPQPAPAPASATAMATSTGLSGLAKTGILAAALAGAGGGGLLGACLGGAFNKPPTAAVVPPAPVTPGGQVTIGIGPDGNLYDPLKAQPGVVP